MDLEAFFLKCQLDSPLKIILFLIASISIILSMFPQIVRIIKRKSADDLSIYTLLLVLTHAIAKGTFELICNVIPLALTSGINGFMVLLGIGAVVKYRKRGPRKSTKFLLISDTHGNLEVINSLARKHNVAAVIHAGDFGFCDGARPHMSNEFGEYIRGKKKFIVPVFAVCGNHDDLEIVKKLSNGSLSIRNLHFLNHSNARVFEEHLIYGVGGNVIPHKLMGDFPAGGRMTPRATASQFTQLVDEIEYMQGLKIFVSHVSPAYEPIVEYVGARTGADVVVSGHMGAKTCSIWTPFSIGPKSAAEIRLTQAKEQLHEFSKGNIFAGPLSTCSCTTEIYPKWYHDMLCINLPNAAMGAAILTSSNGTFSIETIRRQVQCAH